MGAVRLERGEKLHCLVCGDSITADDETVRLSGGGDVHADCATYRMRQRDGRGGYRRPRQVRGAFTGD
jgi:hypothetical protein